MTPQGIGLNVLLPTPTLAKPFSHVIIMSHLPLLCLLHLTWGQYLCGCGCGWQGLPHENVPPSILSRPPPSRGPMSFQPPPPLSPSSWEKCLCILTQRWRVYNRRLKVCSEVADTIVEATCILSNFCLGTKESQHPDCGEPDEADKMENLLALIRNLRGNRASAEVLRVRDTFRQYFTSPAGQVYRQDGYVAIQRGFSV